MGTQKRVNNQPSGFTIVELLVVIVVIGILATITLISYTGIQNRARVATLQSDLENASKQFENYKFNNSVSSGGEFYPPDLATATATAKSSSGTTYPTYFVNNTVSPAEYCLGALNGGLYYTIASGTTPQPGQCVTNLVTNPSLETSSSGWGIANSAVPTWQASSAIFGGYGIQEVAPNNSLDSGANVPISLTTALMGTTYTASVSMRAVTAGTYRLSIQGAGSSLSSVSGDTKTMSVGQVSRFTVSWTPAGSGSVVMYALRVGGTAGVNTFDVDGAMLVVGSFAPGYGDGNTNGWWWTGTQNLSTSIGPGVSP